MRDLINKRLLTYVKGGIISALALFLLFHKKEEYQKDKFYYSFNELAKERIEELEYSIIKMEWLIHLATISLLVFVILFVIQRIKLEELEIRK